MRTIIFAVVALLTNIPLMQSQEVIKDSKIEFNGMTHRELTRRIFHGEKKMMESLRASHPILETYLQSLWPNAETESPIDDAYFLSQVDFSRGYKKSGAGRSGYQTLLFGRSRASKKVGLNSGEKDDLSPNGFLDMLFVDIDDFDADTYDLEYLRAETLGKIDCLLFSVRSRPPQEPGRFRGQIWVESSSLRIIRVEGTFNARELSAANRFGITGPGMYYDFDGWRQEVAPGIWMPSVTYFYENRRWYEIYGDGLADSRERGYAMMWGYNPVAIQLSAVETDPQNEPSLVVSMEHDKLLASEGLVEQRLDEVVRDITRANQIDLTNIRCRILLTSPVEMFTIGHTIVLSRGLLNIVPSGTVIPVLLAHEIAKLVSNATASTSAPLGKSLFSLSGKNDFEGLGLRKPDPSEEAIIWKTAFDLVTRSHSPSAGISETIPFIKQLRERSPQVPNFLRARFGYSLLDLDNFPALTLPTVPEKPLPPLQLGSRFQINSWTGNVVDSYPVPQSSQPNSEIGEDRRWQIETAIP